MVRRVKMPKRKTAHSKHTKKQVRGFRANRPHSKKLTVRAIERRKAAQKAARKAQKEKDVKAAMQLKAREDEIERESEMRRVDAIIENKVFVDFISKNVGKKAVNIIKMLNLPQTDEQLTADLGIKINEVRRILNVLDTYGVARYDTNKDNKGWLTFKWYLDSEKLEELSEKINNNGFENSYKLPEDCNDFFFCGKCYEEQKVIMPFDAAFENQFKCDGCGKQLKQLTKTEAKALFEEAASQHDEIVT